MARSLDIFGRVDILVNNVGVGGAMGTAVEVVSQQHNSGSLTHIR